VLLGVPFVAKCATRRETPRCPQDSGNAGLANGWGGEESHFQPTDPKSVDLKCCLQLVENMVSAEGIESAKKRRFRATDDPQVPRKHSKSR